MKRKKLIAATIGVTLIALASLVYSHCQIPCGIYGDPDRFELMAEHIRTIEKSMNTINEMSKRDKIDYNQLVRWINNKDEHADQFTEIVTYYFLAQRIKPVDASDDKDAHEKYLNKLEMLHHMMVYSMKCKQTTDQENTQKLKSLLHNFQHAYMEN